ncbi:MAG TPA: helix-hairpin-helix domain-containing protein [Trueperaceae bacterium]|nr:helix-hairpin-helix domain-containing protein [Trueperaceae bacterium]
MAATGDGRGPWRWRLISSRFGSRFGDRQLTGVLMAVCVLATAVHMAPRLLVSEAPLTVLQPPIVVAVRGEVAEPGSYSLPFGARVADAVAAAGGLLPAAAPDLVAFAEPLTDGQTVQVPALMARGGTTPRISLNAATPAELDALPGIGPVIAARIVEHRPYARIDDLMRVPGIGPRTLERLAPLVAM